MLRLHLFNLVLGLALFLPATASAVPQQLSQQGRLFDAEGMAVTGSRDLTFRLYDAPTRGDVVWEEPLTAVH